MTRCTPRPARGFTLIELMVTLAIAAILLQVAIPAIRQILLRSQANAISSEFSTALSQARGLAIANNTCATLCTATVSAGNAPVCQAPGTTGYQGGWIVFLNPACNTAQTDPTAAGAVLRQARNGTDNRFSITASDTGLHRLMFDPRGISTAAAAGLFQITATSDAGNANARTVCLDAAGRATVRRYAATCS